MNKGGGGGGGGVHREKLKGGSERLAKQIGRQILSC